jgi:hypothetical protein
VAKFAKVTKPVPQLYTADHYRSWDEAMRQLAIVDALLRKCESCNMPVAQLREECDGLCEFFTGLNRQFRNVQMDQPEAL